MQQFIAIAVGFILIPLWLKLRLSFWIVLGITALILCILAGIAPAAAWSCLTGVFTSRTSMITILVVILVSVLGSLLKQYRIIERGSRSLQKLIRSPKAILMIIPAVFGMLQVPGGAAMSAPFVDQIGDQMELDSSRKAVINLSFRHIAMFLLPFTSTMVYLSGILPEINVYRLVLLNLGFVVCMQSAAYFLFVRPIKPVPPAPKAGAAELRKALKEVIVCFSPIYLVILFNGVFGLPLYLSLCLCIVLTFFLSSKEDFLRNVIRGVNVPTVLIMIMVYLIGNLIKSMDFVMSTFQVLFTRSDGITVLLVVCCIALMLGLTTGLMFVPFSVLLPILAEIPMGQTEKTILVSFVFTWSFVGYYFSPLHLCQILTVDCLKCSLPGVYRYNIKLFAVVALAPFLLYYLYTFILL